MLGDDSDSGVQPGSAGDSSVTSLLHDSDSVDAELDAGSARLKRLDALVQKKRCLS